MDSIVRFVGISPPDRKKLEYEVISAEVRIRITRLLRSIVDAEDAIIRIYRQNQIINIANTVLGLQIYVLESEDGEYLSPIEYAWHNGEMELVARRPATCELVEILGDLIVEKIIDYKVINNIFEEFNVAIWFKWDGKLKVVVVAIEDIEEAHDSNEHPNIRLLIRRMQNAFDNKDWSGVLHASASILETLAKDIVNIPSIQNKSLGSFFDRYRKDSKLPASFLDYIEDIFKRRNTEPLAGHGSIETQKISKEEAVVLVEMTKSMIRIERQLTL